MARIRLAIVSMGTSSRFIIHSRWIIFKCPGSSTTILRAAGRSAQINAWTGTRKPATARRTVIVLGASRGQAAKKPQPLSSQEFLNPTRLRAARISVFGQGEIVYEAPYL